MRVREQIAWAAGLFEGEGCFSGRYSGSRYNPQAALTMCDFDVVVRFQEIIGFGQFYLRRFKGGRQDALEWRVSSFEQFQYVVCLFWPWLGARRRARAAEVLRMVRESRQCE